MNVHSFKKPSEKKSRTQSPEVRRRQILDAARDVLLKKGYQEFRMLDVAHEAGMAAGTLYLYFNDKVELYAGVFMDLLDRLDERIALSQKSRVGLKALEAMTVAVLSFIDDYQDFLFQFTGEQTALAKNKTGLALKKRFVIHLDLLSGPIKETMNELNVPLSNPLSTTLHYSFLARMFMIEKILTESKKPLRHKCEQFLSLFLYGVSQKPHGT